MAMLASSVQATPPSVNAFMKSVDSVHWSCETDVLRFCTPHDDFISVVVSPILSSPMLSSSAVVGGDRNMLRISGSTNDPFSDMLDDMITSTLTLMSPERSSGFDDVENFFDQAVFSLFSGLASPSVTRVSFTDDGRESEESPDEDDSAKETVASETGDSAIERVEKMADSANLLAGKILSSDDVAPSRRRLARRLTAVSPEIVLLVKEKKMNPSLAYGCHVDYCLWKQLEAKSLSPVCSAALETARASFHAMDEVGGNNVSRATQQLSSQNVDELDYLRDLSFAMLHVIFIVTLFFFIFLRCCVKGKLTLGHVRKRSAIIRVVSENPDIRALVEEKLGEDISDLSDLYVPRSGERCFFAKVCDRFCLSLPLFALAVLLFFTSITSPGVVLSVGGPAIFIMCVYLLSRKLYSMCFYLDNSQSDFELEARQPLMDDCTCCDCTCCDGSGMTILDANGKTCEVCCCCGGSKKMQNMDGSVSECPCCCGESGVRATAGNDTGACHNCDVATESCCGDCGCCLSCCTCDGVVTPFLLAI